LEFELQRDIHTAETESGQYYDISLAEYLVTVNTRHPEETTPHLRPWDNGQLPDAGSVGGKNKKRTKKRSGKYAKKTRRRR
jgi:hypothetical protein